MVITIMGYLEQQIAWSRKAHGPGSRAEGLCKHIENEVQEIRDNPTDLMEWIDVIILAFDGAWRAGYNPFEIEQALHHKLAINKKRKWPRKSQDEPQHHIKEI